MLKFTRIVTLAIGLSIGMTSVAMKTVTGTAVQGFEPTNVKTTVGEENAESTCYFVMRWNDSKGVENIAFGLKFNPSETDAPDALFQKVFSEDWRFYKDTRGAYCFDLNGDKVHDGDTAQYDHSALDGADGEWVLTAPNANVKDGDVILAEFIPASGEKGKFADASLFYLPASDTPGAWITEGLSFALADATYEVPVYINLCGGAISSALNFTYRVDPDATRTDSSIAGMVLSKADAEAGKTVATLTSKKEGNIYIGSRLYYLPVGATKKTYTDYSFSQVKVTEPVARITGIRWNFPDEPFPLSHSYLLRDYVVIEPENVTYTGGLTFKVTASDPKNICGISATTGTLNTRTTPGKATLSVTAKCDATITDTGEIEIALVKPVQGISFVNIDPSKPVEIEFDPYKMEYNNTNALLKVEPSDADISKLELKLIDPKPENPNEKGKVIFELGQGNGTTAPREYDLLTTYQQNDGAYDLYAWGLGTTKAVFAATDGTGIVSPEITVNIVPRKMNITDDFSDGTFWLNEDWFGHSNGSINYIDADGNLNYRVYNFANYNEETPRENRTFGCTSQYGMIFGDRLYVMSKQAHDTGDRYQTGGGRLVIADAKTLKRITSFDVIGADEKRGGDGRACVGVSADKVYIGHHAGIRVLNIDNSAETPEKMFMLGKELNFSDENIGGDTTPGNPGGALYSNQIGDMVYACGHVFAVMQDRGLMVIDTETDTYIKTLGDHYTQAVTQSADGDIWYARNNTDAGIVSLHRVNPETLEETEEYELPSTAGTINTGWGAWRSANFFASRQENVLFWGNVGSGYQDDILGKGTGNIYRWEIGQELPTEPFFALGDRPGKDENTFQSPYATMRYDDRTNQILMATTHGASYNYRYNWLYFINGTTGEIERIMEPSRYFWFPAIPIFPDKHAPEINVEQLVVRKLGEETRFDMTPYISDEDNISRNINLRVEEPATIQSRLLSQDEEPIPDFACTLKGHNLYLKMNKSGERTLKLIAESNGKEVSKNIKVIYDTNTGLENVHMTEQSVYAKEDFIKVRNMDGVIFNVYDITGTLCEEFKVIGNEYVRRSHLDRGIYFFVGNNGFVKKAKID